MAPTNVATRLGRLVDEARQHGHTRMTVPALDVWIKTFGLLQPEPQEVFAALSATHRNIQRLKQQMSLANPTLLADCESELGALEDAFSIRRLENPWNNTRQILGDKVKLSLKACAAALDGRFDERDISGPQLNAADRLLADFLSQVVAEDLPQQVQSFLLRSTRELRTALRYVETLGPDQFAAIADHLIGDIGRGLAAAPDEQSKVRKLAKRLGVIVASISAAVTLGLGVIALDQETVNLLPWGDDIDPIVVRCVVEPENLPQLLAQTISTGTTEGDS